MSNKLIISDFYKEHLLGFQVKDQVLQRIIDLNDNVVGNIYCGYVKDVVKNIGAAFVEFGDKKGFLPLHEENIKQGDKVLIQVKYDAIKSKDYGLTTQISLNGKYIVLTVGNTQVSISKKINDETVRDSLKQLMDPFKNDEYGFILRTKSADAASDEIISEINELTKNYEDIKRKFIHSKAKELLYSCKKYVVEAKEFLDKSSGEIITDNEEVYSLLNAEKIAVSLYQDKKISLCNFYKLGKIIDDALNRKVYMKSGAYLVIDYTESLTVIDVNTGKADSKGNREETFIKINHEAAKEISRQMEIRNISGIILVDFINMKNPLEYQKLQDAFTKELKRQSVSCMVMGFTKLGLMELSRKKKDKPLHEVIGINDTNR